MINNAMPFANQVSQETEGHRAEVVSTMRRMMKICLKVGNAAVDGRERLKTPRLPRLPHLTHLTHLPRLPPLPQLPQLPPFPSLWGGGGKLGPEGGPLAPATSLPKDSGLRRGKLGPAGSHEERGGVCGCRMPCWSEASEASGANSTGPPSGASGATSSSSSGKASGASKAAGAI